MFFRKSKFRRLRRLEVLVRAGGPLWLRPENYRFSLERLVFLIPVIVGYLQLQFVGRDGWSGLFSPKECGWPLPFWDSAKPSVDGFSFAVDLFILAIWVPAAMFSWGIVFVSEYSAFPYAKVNRLALFRSVFLPIILFQIWTFIMPEVLWTMVLCISILPGLVFISFMLDKRQLKKLREYQESVAAKNDEQIRANKPDRRNPNSAASGRNDPYQTPGYRE